MFQKTEKTEERFSIFQILFEKKNENQNEKTDLRRFASGEKGIRV